MSDRRARANARVVVELVQANAADRKRELGRPPVPVVTEDGAVGCAEMAHNATSARRCRGSAGLAERVDCQLGTRYGLGQAMEPAYRVDGGADGSYQFKRSSAGGGRSVCRWVRQRALRGWSAGSPGRGRVRTRRHVRSIVERCGDPVGRPRSARGRSRCSTRRLSPCGAQRARRELVAHGDTAGVSRLVSGTWASTEGC